MLLIEVDYLSLNWSYWKKSLSLKTRSLSLWTKVDCLSLSLSLSSWMKVVC
jgi:hypothetical protein